MGALLQGINENFDLFLAVPESIPIDPISVRLFQRFHPGAAPNNFVANFSVGKFTQFGALVSRLSQLFCWEG